MESNDVGASSSARAQQLRASLGARREVETLLAEASATRQAAAADADAIVEEAQQLSEELLAESRAAADRTRAEAHERAEGIVARAREEADDLTRQARSAADTVRARAEAEVEDYRRRVRAEVTEQVTRELEERNRAELVHQHERQEAMIGDLEASVRILGVSLDSAAANVGELLGSLDDLRAHSAGSLGDAGLAAAAPAEDPRDDLFRVTSPTPEPSTDVSDEPASATEAFLSSAHLDHGDPPLPPMDDDEIGARYARDAMRATARARTRQDAETLGVGPERVASPRREPDERGRVADGGPAHEFRESRDPREPGDSDVTGKPLGWLFRSS